MITRDEQKAAKLRRAPKACCRCHERKVRCDVARLGTPCSNCQAADIECMLVEGRKRGRRRRVALEPKEDDISITDAPVNLEDMQKSDENGSPSAVGTSPSDVIEVREAATQEAETRTTNAHNLLQNSFSSLIEGLPAYINSLPARWTEREVRYVTDEEVFAIPEPGLRNALLQSYIEWVHPLCPLLDLHEFLFAIARPDGSGGTISLLVLWSVLFAGTAFVDASFLSMAGYSSRMAARRCFFNKAKLLYSFGYENDRLRIVQALLLMSYWQETHDEATNHWYWAELGCLAARTIGLYRDPSATGMSKQRQSLWKRIGWSCMLRDRVLNLGVRMPSKIRENEFSVPLLDESDFQIGVFASDVIEMLGECDFIRNPYLQSLLARICIEKTKLCLLCGQVFSTLYTDANPKLGVTTEVTLILMPNAQGANDNDVRQLGQNLQNWLHSLPADVQHQQPKDPILGSNQEIFLVHHSMVMMFYHAIMSAFYRPQLLVTTSPASGRDFTRERMRYASLMITRHLEDVQMCDLLRFLPSASVTFLLTAAINHLVEYKTSVAEENKQRHLHRFRDCLSYLHPLQSVHIYAKYAEIFLNTAALQAGITAELFSGSSNTVQSTSPEEGNLGTWAVAHTPDLLVEQPTMDLRAKLLHDGNSLTQSLSTMSDGETHASRIMIEPYESSNIGLDPQNYLSTLDYAAMENVLNSTVMEHGWLDEIAERWPEYVTRHQSPSQGTTFNAGDASMQDHSSVN